MTDNPSVPDISTPVIDRATGLIDEEWYRYFELLERQGTTTRTIVTGGTVDLHSVEQRLTADEAAIANLQLHNEDVHAQIIAAGFGFYSSGVFASGELIGQAAWARDITFTNDDPDICVVVAPGYAPTADAVFKLKDISLTLLGTITVAAGALLGAVSWVNDPYVHFANKIMLIFAPNPADATLSNTTATVTGRLNNA